MARARARGSAGGWMMVILFWMLYRINSPLIHRKPDTAHASRAFLFAMGTGAPLLPRIAAHAPAEHISDRLCCHTHTHMCVCVCACVRARARCVFVCVRVRACVRACVHS